jgi:hypothetical protein
MFRSHNAAIHDGLIFHNLRVHMKYYGGMEWGLTYSTSDYFGREMWEGRWSFFSGISGLVYNILRVNPPGGFLYRH